MAALAVVDVAQIGNPSAPDEPALARFYEENEARYIAPEYRSATYVWIAPDALIGEIEVTQDELERTYEARLNTYFTPGSISACMKGIQSFLKRALHEHLDCPLGQGGKFKN